jgi:hypothetical protein
MSIRIKKYRSRTGREEVEVDLIVRRPTGEKLRERRILFAVTQRTDQGWANERHAQLLAFGLQQPTMEPVPSFSRFVTEEWLRVCPSSGRPASAGKRATAASTGVARALYDHDVDALCPPLAGGGRQAHSCFGSWSPRGDGQYGEKRGSKLSNLSASPGGFEPRNAHFGKPAKAWTFSWIAEELKQVERRSRLTLASLHSPSIARVRGAGGEAGARIR